MRLKLPGILTHDFLRKAVALFFALLIWLSVSTNVRDEEIVLKNVPLTVKYDPNVVVLRDSAKTVDVSLRGSRRRLEEVSSQDVQIAVQVPADIHEGVYYYGVGLSAKNNVRHAPPGIRVTGITPDRVELHIDRLVTKPNVSVKVEYVGSLREGYEVMRATPVPATVVLKGPHRDLLDIIAVKTEPILLDDTIVQDFTVTARLVTIPGVLMSETVRVDLAVGRRSSLRTLHGVPLSVLIDPAVGLRIEGPLPQIAVTLRGPKASLDEVTELSVCPFLDLSAITSPGRYRRQVNTWLTGAGDVIAESAVPTSVEVTLAPTMAREGGMAPPPSPPAPGNGQGVPP
jgi:YbbR domain-containing protein